MTMLAVVLASTAGLAMRPSGTKPARHAATQDKQAAATAIAAAEAKRKRRQEKRRSQPQ